MPDMLPWGPASDPSMITPDQSQAQPQSFMDWANSGGQDALKNAYAGYGQQMPQYSPLQNSLATLAELASGLSGDHPESVGNAMQHSADRQWQGGWLPRMQAQLALNNQSTLALSQAEYDQKMRQYQQMLKNTRQNYGLGGSAPAPTGNIPGVTPQSAIPNAPAAISAPAGVPTSGGAAAGPMDARVTAIPQTSPSSPSSAPAPVPAYSQGQQPQTAAQMFATNPYDMSNIPAMVREQAAQAQASGQDGQAVITSYIEKNRPTWGVIGQNALGQQQYGWIDPLHQTVMADKGAGSQSGVNSIDVNAMANLPTVQDRLDYVKQRDPATANMLNGWLSGNVQFDRARVGQNAPMYERLLTSIDGNWSPSIAENRARIRQELDDTKTTGSLGWNQYALNKSIEHMGTLWDTIENGYNGKKAPGYYSGWGSGVGNWVSGEANAFNNDPTVSYYDSAANMAGPEIEKFVSGKAATDTGSAKMASDLDLRKGPDAAKAAIMAKLDLMKGNVRTLTEQAKRGLGPTAPPDFSLLSPTSQAIIGKVTGGKDIYGNAIPGWKGNDAGSSTGGGGLQEGATATNAQGHRIILKGGKWQSM